MERRRHIEGRMDGADGAALVVRSRNELVNTKFRFSEFELDELFYILHLVRDDVLEYSFPLRELRGVTGETVDGRSFLRYAGSLAGRQSLTYRSDEDWEFVPLFQRIGYRDGVVRVKINPDAMPLFRQTRKEFTVMSLRAALSLSGKYAKRLYWMLNQWKRRGGRTYALDELRQYFGMDTPSGGGRVVRSAGYARNFNLKAKVDAACAEITRASDIAVTAVWRKAGRSLHSVTFVIGARGAAGDTAFTDDPAMAEAFRLFRLYRLTDAQCRELWRNGCTAEAFGALLKRVNAYLMKHPGSVGDSVAYIVGCLEKEGYLAPARRMTVREMVEMRGRRGYAAARRQTVATIRDAVSKGAPLDCFVEMMGRFGIAGEEVV